MKNKESLIKKASLDEIIFGALSQLQTLNYNPRSIRRYQSTWKRLTLFAEKNNFKNKLSERLMFGFLSYHEISNEMPTTSIKGWKKHAEFSLKILWNYARFGYFERCAAVLEKLHIPPTMKKTLLEYKKYCKDKRHYSEYTVEECVRHVGLFLDFLGKRNVNKFNQIKPIDVSDFVYTLSRFSQKTISGIVSYVRVFMRYLFLKNILKVDLSKALPSVRVCHDAWIPSVWDKGDLVKLLDAIDRSSPRGKRDYAIILLACRLGLRLGDISMLTLDDIDWESESISIVQSKTKTPLSLPLIDEVGNALIDYIKSARPNKTKYRQVFLRLTYPFTPIYKNHHLHSIVSHWKEIAGIKFENKQRQGIHSLRHSLASYLLEENVPFSLISNILGHTSSNSTMIYAKSSIETLRQVALSMKGIDYVK